MAFTGQGGSGQTITQTTGTTDANPSGISALSGVTTRTQGLLQGVDMGVTMYFQRSALVYSVAVGGA